MSTSHRCEQQPCPDMDNDTLGMADRRPEFDDVRRELRGASGLRCLELEPRSGENRRRTCTPTRRPPNLRRYRSICAGKYRRSVFRSTCVTARLTQMVSMMLVNLLTTFRKASHRKGLAAETTRRMIVDSLANCSSSGSRSARWRCWGERAAGRPRPPGDQWSRVDNERATCRAKRRPTSWQQPRPGTRYRGVGQRLCSAALRRPSPGNDIRSYRSTVDSRIVRARAAWLPSARSTTARTAGGNADHVRIEVEQHQPIPFQPRFIPDKGSESWPSTSGRHDCAAPCRTETRAPACTPRTAPATRRSAPGAARRTRHRRRRSRTPGPPATPTRRRGPQSSSARESSLPAGPAPRLQNPQPMSELRNHPRKLTPNSATFTRTGQADCLVHLKIARDVPRLLGLAILVWTIPAPVVQIHIAIPATDASGRVERVQHSVNSL